MADKHVIFDLDHTLWDFESNSQETLAELYDVFELKAAGIPDVGRFIDLYKIENDRCWADYRSGRMTKEVLRTERFLRALRLYEADDPALANRLADAYVERSPSKTRLMPGTIEVLEHSRDLGYRLHILTNGFKEVQYRKLDGSGLSPYFTHIFTSEEIGYTKPHAGAFLHALERAGALPENTWMIGDSLEADVIGAHAVGLTTVLYHPHEGPEPEVPHFAVKHLLDLKALL